jgi:uncharacterized repeat protein (TIGR03803 family)
MIDRIKKVIALTLVLALVVFSIKPLLVAEAYADMYSFSEATGVSPRGSLVYVEGLLYGLARDGGINNAGVIFSYNPNTLTYTVLYEFNGIQDGANPEGSLFYIDGVLYGTTTLAGGGSGEGFGTLFSYAIASDTFAVLHTFGLTVGDGQSPTRSLVYVESTDTLYGMTNKGGSIDGTIFSFTIGTTTYTKLFDFDTATGVRPVDSLTYYDGLFYGTTSSGGAYDAGVVFSFEEGGDTPYVVLHNFGENEGDGGDPRGSVVFDDSGVLYGLTSGIDIGQGVIFSFDKIKGYQILHTFTDETGVRPYGSLLYDNVSKLYGMTSAGGSNGIGVLFSYDTFTDIYTVNENFDSQGHSPQGSLVFGENILYGLARAGGDNNLGALFQADAYDLTPDPFSFNELFDVSQNSQIVSDDVTITGVNTTVPVVITDCDSTYCAVNKGETFVAEGQAIAIVVESGECGTTNSATVRIGTISAVFRINTESCGGGGGGGGDEDPPVITTFSGPSTSSSLTIALTFIASDDNDGITYYVSEDDTTPDLSVDWRESITEYTFSSYAVRDLYAWAKDAANNISGRSGLSIVLTEPTPPPPDPEPEPEPDPEDPDDENTGGGGSSSGSSVAGAGTVGVQPPTPPAPVVVEVPTQAPAPVAVVAPRPRSEPAIVLDSPIKKVIQRNFTPAQVEIIEISIKAIIATVTAIGGAIVLASVLFLNPLARPEFILIPIRLWNLLLILLGLRKKPVPWGTVYDAITKQPVDPVRVSLIDIEGKVVETSITDSSGRYGFAAAPGIYKVVLSKTNYLFPSHVIAQENDMRDELYEKPYFGDYLPYDPQVPIIKNIPIDPIDFDTAAFAKKNGDLSFRYSKREIVAERLFNTIFFTTFAIVVASLFIYPEKYSVIVFALYVAAFILRRHNKRMKHTGRIYDMYGNPLAHVVIKIYSAVDSTLVKTIKTSRSGRYYAHIPKGLYTIRVERKTSDGLYVPVYSSPELLVQHGILNKVFNIAYS